MKATPQGRPAGWVAVLATLDTKGEEAAWLRRSLAERGLPVRVVDVGILGEPSVPLEPDDVPRQEVARRAGLGLSEVARLRRDEAMAAMGRGAASVLAQWHREGHLLGAVGIGGNQGTAVAAMAMRELPIGTPRVLVSTVASGNLRPYLGFADIAVLFSVGDLLGGPNPLTRAVLARAAAMLAGMVEQGSLQPARAAGKGLVALSALGNTHPAAERIVAGLRQLGWEVVPFHASGAGGSAMEQLMRQGWFRAVVDLTPHELVGEVFPEDIYAPVVPGRLAVAGELGLPQVVAPGGLDYLIFGTPDSVPPRFRDRPTHYHNPYNTNVQASPEEMALLGEEVARRLSRARGPVAFVDPLKGWSRIGSPGGPVHNPAGLQAFREAFWARVDRNRVRYRAVDCTINDPEFAEAVMETFRELVAGGG